MDYFKILNMTKEPFSNSPDPAFFFQSQQHVQILQKLELAIRLRRGLNVVVGEVGTGKTTLCRQLIRRFDGDPMVETHLILDSHMNTPLEFLTSVARLFGEPIPESGVNEWQMKELIKQHLFLKGVDENKAVVLILDEGQNIPSFGLEILREFLNYETNEFKLLQIIIFAQKEFDDIIMDYPNFSDRINYYQELGPFDFEETRAMILFRLRQASKDGRLPVTFTYPALRAIYRASGGYPRKIIHLCHKVMLALIIKNQTKANWALISACTRQAGPETTKRWPWRWAVAAGMVLILGALLFWQWVPEVQKPSQPPEKPKLMVKRKLASPGRWQSAIKTPKPDEGMPELRSDKKEAEPVPSWKGELVASVKDLDTPSSSKASRGGPAPEAKLKAKSPLTTEAKLGRLEKIRGASHKDYWRIVFQFEDKIFIDQPSVQGKEAILRLKNVTTNLDNFLQFKTFPSWVRLKKVENDLEAQIGLPEKFSGLNYFFLKSPFRLVVDLYKSGGSTSMVPMERS